MKNILSWVDITVIIVYFISIIAVGLWFSRRNRNTSKGYFFAGRSLGWFVVGSALFASNISTVHLVGLAQSGFENGIVYGNFEWLSAFELLILAFFFIPFYSRTKISTLPEFLEKRYDGRSRTIMAFISIAMALFGHIGVSFYAGAVVFDTIFGFNIFLSIIVIATATGIYTIIGGLTSVVVTETLQTIILLIGASILTGLAIYHLPDVGITSYEGLKKAVTPEYLHMVAFDPKVKGFTFLDMVAGHLVLGIWYWCSDQTIVQRVLGAKSQRQAKLGAVFAGFLKIFPVFLMVLPGILAFVLFKDEIGADTKNVLPIMIIKLLPLGVQGLMIAALLAAVMSSVASALNSCSTLVVFDIFQKISPNLSDKKKVFIGRVTSFIVLVASVIWSSFLGGMGGIFELINQIFSAFAPSIATVFLWGVISKKGTSKASFWTLVLGSLLGVIAFGVEKYVPVGGIINFISSSYGLHINWLRQIIVLFAISSAIYWSISFLDTVPRKNFSKDFFVRSEKHGKKIIVLSLILILAMLTLYVIFY